MKYTDHDSNITFNNVKAAGVYHASGPIGLNDRYRTDSTGTILTGIQHPELSLINAIDIDWNGAQVDPEVELNTTGDLLKWIKSKGGNSGSTNFDVYIDENGYWVINGTNTGIKAIGKNGKDGKDGIDGEKGDAFTFDDFTEEQLNRLRGYDGRDGTNGTNGKSAFELALENGFNGSIDEWLASLKGEKGDPGDGSSYDDSELQSAITQLRNSLSSLSSTVQSFRNWSENEINSLIQMGLSHWDLAQSLTPDMIFRLQGWDDKLKAFVQAIAYKDSENNEFTISEILQRLNSIELLIDNIRIVDKEGNEITFEQLVASVKTAVETDIAGYRTAVSTLEAAFNTFKQGTEGDITSIKSSIAALQATANELGASIDLINNTRYTKDEVDEIGRNLKSDIIATSGLASKTYVDGQVAAATQDLVSSSTLKNYIDGNAVSLQEALSGLAQKTYVDNEVTRATQNLVTSAEVESAIDGKVTEALSGVATKSYVNEHITSASASLLAESSVYKIQLYPNGSPVLDGEGRVKYYWEKEGQDTLIQHDSPTGEGWNRKLNESATAGFVASTEIGDLKTATASMQSEIDGINASIGSFVTKDENGVIESQVKVKAENFIYESDGTQKTGFRIKNGNNVVAEITGDGRVSFNDEKVIIPTVTQSWGGGLNTNSNGLLVKSADSSSNNTQCFYQGNSILIQDLNGTPKCSLWNTGNSDSLHLSSYSSNYTQQNIKSVSMILSANTDNGRIAFYNLNYSDGQKGGKFLIDRFEQTVIQTGDLKVQNGNVYTSGVLGANESIDIRTDKSINLITDTESGNISLQSNSISAKTDIVVSSDERLKTKVADINITSEEIAQAPAIVFTRNDIENSKEYIGTIAQYWQNILPQSVSEFNGKLGLNYSTLALVNTIQLAKEIVTLKNENEELKNRITILEQKIQNI